MEASLVGSFPFLIFIAPHNIVDLLYGSDIFDISRNHLIWRKNWSKRERYDFEENVIRLLWVNCEECYLEKESLIPSFLWPWRWFEKESPIPSFRPCRRLLRLISYLYCSSPQGLSHHPASHMGHSFCRGKNQEEKGQTRSQIQRQAFF